MPFKVLPELQRPIYEQIAKRDADLYAGLAKAGFQYNFGEDGSGIHSLYLRRGAGYYIEVGASKMIIDGSIKLKAGVSVEQRRASARSKLERRQRAARRPHRVRHRLRLDEPVGARS